MNKDIIAVVIVEENKLLMLQEAQPRVYGMWNLPAGHVDYGENVIIAAKRETKEETGYDVEITKLIGLQNYISKKKDHHIQFIFWGNLMGGILQYDKCEINNGEWDCYRKN